MAKFPGYPNLDREIREYPLAAGQSFIEGAIVLLDASGDVIEAATDPATILGVAMHAAGADPNPLKVLVAIAKDNTFIFSSTTAPLQSDEGDAFGVLREADGTWVIDRAEVVNTRVRVEKVYIGNFRDQLEVKFLQANRQLG